MSYPSKGNTGSSGYLGVLVKGNILEKDLEEVSVAGREQRQSAKTDKEEEVSGKELVSLKCNRAPSCRSRVQRRGRNKAIGFTGSHHMQLGHLRTRNLGSELIDQNKLVCLQTICPLDMNPFEYVENLF